MLLISSTLPPGFILPGERVPEWYGISESSAQRGLAELREVGLLNLSISYKPTPLEKIQTTEVYNAAGNLARIEYPDGSTRHPGTPGAPPDR